MQPGIQWPDGKTFAFTIFDDTDLATIANVGEVYSFLNDTGFRTTKSVWPIRGSGVPRMGGQTCADREYLDWIYKIKGQGFEIALHNVTYHTSDREMTILGLRRFRDLFGHPPSSMANHVGCRESIYWGDQRVSGLRRVLYNFATRFRRRGQFEGHREDSSLFWGDLCRENIKYVRNFVYRGMNTLKHCPLMPYHDRTKPYVNYWFASADGSTVRPFNNCISDRSQDRLEEEGGACIMYSHLASGFTADGGLDKRFVELMNRLSRKNGWFVPVSELLDFLLAARGHCDIGRGERAALEWKWLCEKIMVGTN